MSQPTPVLPQTLAQIRALAERRPADPLRPLVICDVDEVVLHFLAPLESHLGDHGCRFVTHEYRLAGNIADADGRLLDPVAVRGLIASFFEAWTHRQTPVDGAAATLRALAGEADIVFLTNLPGETNRDTRIANLASHDMDYPLVTNSGPKGGAVAALAAGRRAPVVFIDDSPTNISSVRDSYALGTLVHFIADRRFFAGAGEIDGVALKTHDWHDAGAYIRQRIGG